MGALTEHERGMLMSSMANSSVALTLGRSVRWVARMRDILAVDPTPAAETVQARAGQSVAAWEARQVQAGESAVPEPRKSRARPRALKDQATDVEQRVKGDCPARRLKAPAIPPRQRGRRIPAVPAADRKPMANFVPAERALKARVVGWAWWFVAAGWPLGEVAALFDVAADRLAAALADRGAPS